MKRKLFSTNELINKCKYFYWGQVNNGYCCCHPEQEEKIDGEGCCYYFSCPFSYEAEQEDMDNKKIDKNGYTELGGLVVCEVDENDEIIY